MRSRQGPVSGGKWRYTENGTGDTADLLKREDDSCRNPDVCRINVGERAEEESIMFVFACSLRTAHRNAQYRTA